MAKQTKPTRKLTARAGKLSQIEGDAPNEEDVPDQPEEDPGAPDEEEPAADGDEEEMAGEDGEEDVVDGEEPVDGEEEDPADESRQKTAGRRAERKRIAAIVRGKEARGRMPTALSLALDTGLSADEAKKVLASAPKGSGGGLADAMASHADVNIGSDGGEKLTGDDAVAARIRANHAAVTGRR